MRTLMVALVLAAGVTLFSVFVGTSDLENSLKISYSVAIAQDQKGFLGGPEKVGTFTKLGVPLYDALSGTGHRLPFVGSWAQSPDWPLRLLFNANFYIHLRIFLVSFIAYYSLFYSLKTWKRVNFTQLVLCGILSSGSAGLYLHWNEWTDNYLATMATVSLVMVLLRRENYVRINQGFFGESSVVFVCALSFGVLTSSHISLAVIGGGYLLFLLLGNCLISQNYRISVVRTWRDQKLQLFLVLSGGLLVLSVNLLDLWSSTGSEVFSDSKYEDLLGTYGDGWLTGISRGLVPTAIESSIALLLTMFLLPLVFLLTKILPNSTIQDQLAEAFPRAEFGGFMVMLIAIRLLRKGRMKPAVRRLASGVCLANAASTVLVLAATYDFLLPRQIVPSGGFLLFPVMLVSSVFLTVVLNEEPGVIGAWVKLILRVNLFAVLIWTLFLFGFGRKSDQLLPAITETSSVYLNHSDYWELSRVLNSGARSIAIGSPLSFTNNGNSLISLPMSGKSLIAPAMPKTRNLMHLVEHVPLDAAVGVWNPGDLSYEEVDKILDFLEVGFVIVSQNDPFAAKLTSDVFPSIDEIQELRLADVNYLVGRRNFFTTVVIDKQEVPNVVCPILSRMCAVTSHSIQANSTSEPHLTVCEKSCLWTYRIDFESGARNVLIPVTFDEALRVTNSKGADIPTSNFGGFLLLDLTENVSGSELTISVKLDTLMWLRVVSSYWTAATISALGVWMFTRKLRFSGCSTLHQSNMA
jgi:hypothetical protein